MRFSHKFLLFVLSVLIIMIATNIVALKYFTTEYFREYREAIRQDVPDLDFDLISAFTKTKDLDEATIAEYRTVIRDLSTISRSLENLSKNPGAYAPGVIDSLQKIGVSDTSIEQVLFANAIDSFFANLLNFSVLGNTTPEGKFVMQVLRSMVVVNAILIVSIIVATGVWVHWSFRPVESIIENLSGIIHRRAYKRLKYTKNDEFGALIKAINSLNESLSHQEKIRSDMLSDLSHEIKTPITAIKCYLEGMDDGVIALNAQNRKMLHREIDRLIDITNSIMEYEKLEQQEAKELKIESFDLAELISSVIDEYIPSLQKTKQSIVHKSDRKFTVSMDYNRTVQILHNIFSNFIKYAGEGTTLSIRLAKRNMGVSLTFADNGAGIPKEEISFVKEKFYQVEKSRTHGRNHGVGIGLSVIEKIAELHGGRCNVESDTGKGFKIRIVLPIA